MMSLPAIRQLGRADYESTWCAMRAFTHERTASTPDEFWVVEHPSVFTLGQAGRAEHLRDTGEIPVIRADRGGQVTWHGPGQVVVYLLVDLRRRGYGVKEMVARMEAAVIELLAGYGIHGRRHAGAPGIYVDGAKIAALGLRVRRGCTYHGLAFNVDCDLEPFTRIDPCGYPDLAATRLRDLGVGAPLPEVAVRLVESLAKALGYTAAR